MASLCVGTIFGDGMKSAAGISIGILVVGFLGGTIAQAQSSPSGLAPAVAILPIQNEGDPYFSLGESSSDLQKITDFVVEHAGKTPKDRDSLAAAAVRDSLVFQLGKSLLTRGYRVYMGKDYDEFYRQLETRGRETSYAELQAMVPADAFLLVHLDQWDGAEFDSAGRLRIAYRLYLIDPKRTQNKGIVWSRASKDVLELEPNDFLFRKRREEMIREVVRVLLSGLPPCNPR